MKDNFAKAAILALFVAFCTAVSASQRPSSRSVREPQSKSADRLVPKPVAFPLKLSENRRYLVDQNGTPFLIVGDSPQGIMDRLTEREADDYFANREAHGFNTLGWINVVCAGHDYSTNTYATTPDGIRPFTGFLSRGLTGFFSRESDYTYYDLSKPNEAYFIRLDDILRLAQRHHFLVFLDPIETIGWLPVLRRNGRQAAYAYGQFLGRRYGRYPNLIWLNGNDFWNWREGQDGALWAAARDGVRSFLRAWPKRNDDDLVRAVAQGIRSEASPQLQTLELEPSTSSSFDDPTWKSLIWLNGTYTYFPAYLQTLVSYNQQPTAPTWLMESRYEFDRGDIPPDEGTPAILRLQEYWSMLSGGVGQFYGNAYIWPFKDGWRDKLDTVGVQQVEYWRDFFLSIPWQNLIPDQAGTVITSGAGATCDFTSWVGKCFHAQAASSSDGSVVVIYSPSPRLLSVNMGALNHPAMATWFDPSSGTYKAVNSEPLPNSGIQQFISPGKNQDGDEDWILLLRAVDQSPQNLKESPPIAVRPRREFKKRIAPGHKIGK
jgi:hypothetical protein